MKTDLVVLDLETGGFEPYENPITEVAAHIVDPITFKVKNKYNTYVRPYNGLKITPEAINATQVDMKMVENGIDIKNLIPPLINIFKQARNNARYQLPQIVGHNIPFDMKFLVYAFELNKKNLFDYVDPLPICTMRLIRLHDANLKDDGSSTSEKLGDCCERFGIKLRSAHGADNDVIATTSLLKVLSSKLRSEYIVGGEEKVAQVKKSREHFKM